MQNGCKDCLQQSRIRRRIRIRTDNSVKGISENGLYYRGAQIYNELPTKMKELIHDKFQTKLKFHLRENEIWNSND